MKNTTKFTIMALLTASSAFAGPEVSGGYGYMSYDLVDRGQSQYTLKNNTYSGGFFRVQANYAFPLEHATLSLGAFVSLPAFRNDVMTSTPNVSITFPWTRVGAETKVSVPWLSAVAPYGRLGIGYETWQVEGAASSLNFEYGSFSGAYVEIAAGLDITVLGPLRLFGEMGVASGYQTGRFVDPVALAANKVSYYDTSTRTRGFYVIVGASLRF